MTLCVLLRSSSDLLGDETSFSQADHSVSRMSCSTREVNKYYNEGTCCLP